MLFARTQFIITDEDYQRSDPSIAISAGRAKEVFSVCSAACHQSLLYSLGQAKLFNFLGHKESTYQILGHLADIKVCHQTTKV